MKFYQQIPSPHSDWNYYETSLNSHQIVLTNRISGEQIKVPNIWYNRPNPTKSFLPSKEYWQSFTDQKLFKTGFWK